MSVLKTTPQFLYPHSRQFPFDEVAEKIVRAIEKRNWKVPGITIEFRTYGSGEAKYQMIRSITGDNFYLGFCRFQGILNGPWIDLSALHSICIPKESIDVFDDESGPSYWLYVGNDWESDKEWFMHSFKYNAKQNKEPRRYLRYKGNTYNKRAQELVAFNDFFNREYLPEGNEPVRINLEQKFNEITAWLKEFVLDYILSFQEADIIQAPTPTEELVPYKGPWSTVFTICNYDDAERIKKGKENPNQLPPEERYALEIVQRLVALNVQSNVRFPEIANEGFIWCDVNQEEKVTQNSKLAYEILDAMKYIMGKNYIVAIKLKYANKVYVADNSKYKEIRQELLKAIFPRFWLKDEELGNAIASRGATIIPITEYKGDYKEPIVLINRELDFDEIDWVVRTEK